MLALGTQTGHVQIWDPLSEKKLYDLRGHRGRVGEAFTPPLYLLLSYSSFLLFCLPSPHLPTPNVHEIESENCYCMGVMLNRILLYATYVPYSRGKCASN